MRTEIYLIGIVLLYFLVQLVFICIHRSNKKIYYKNVKSSRADELPKLPETIDAMEYEHKYCMNCKVYDGYDVCLHRKHWGSVIQNTVEYCKRDFDYIPKGL